MRGLVGNFSMGHSSETREVAWVLGRKVLKRICLSYVLEVTLKFFKCIYFTNNYIAVTVCQAPF